MLIFIKNQELRTKNIGSTALVQKVPHKENNFFEKKQDFWRIFVQNKKL